MGVISALAFLLGVALVAATSWLSERAGRVLGSFLLAIAVTVIARFAVGLPLAALLGVVAGPAAFRFAPTLVLRRVTFLVPALVLMMFATVLLMFAAPGNPFANERVASPEVEAALRARYGVPASGVEFFAIYLKRLLIDGTLGPSIKVQGRSVEDLLGPAFPVSLSLGLLALMLSVAIGLSFGFYAGLKPKSFADHASTSISLVGISLPNFVIGAGLMIVFALWLGWLPVAGWGSYAHLALPAITLALPNAAVVARLARSGMVEVMQQDFVRTARAKGLPEHLVVGRHAFRGAILPVVSYLGPAAATIMTGSFVVEVLFGVPGMGQWFVKGAVNRDYSVVLGTALIYFGLITFFNLVVDLAYAWLDPRVRGRT
jgi:oligopeptide transport system permease protein